MKLSQLCKINLITALLAWPKPIPLNTPAVSLILAIQSTRCTADRPIAFLPEAHARPSSLNATRNIDTNLVKGCIGKEMAIKGFSSTTSTLRMRLVPSPFLICYLHVEPGDVTHGRGPTFAEASTQGL